MPIEQLVTPSAERPRDPSGRRSFPTEVVLLILLVAAIAVLFVDLRRGGEPDPVMTFLTLEGALAAWELPNESVARTARSALDASEWLMALKIDPEFHNCTASSGEDAAPQVVCSVVMGGPNFFSLVLGRHATGRVSGSVQNGVPIITAWDIPAAWDDPEREFQDFMEATAPELAPRMFGPDRQQPYRFTKESGALHMLYLDAFLSSRPVDPLGAVEDFAAALARADIERVLAALPEGHRGYDTFEYFDRNFWEWTMSLEQPQLSGCAVTGSSPNGTIVRCDSVDGVDSWFTQVLGHQPTTTFATWVTDRGILAEIDYSHGQGVVAAEIEFRRWIRRHHPEEEDSLFGDDHASVLKYDQAAADGHWARLDEYLRHLES